MMPSLHNAHLKPEYIEQRKKELIKDGMVFTTTGKPQPIGETIWSNYMFTYISKDRAYFDELINDYIDRKNASTQYFKSLELVKYEGKPYIRLIKGNDQSFTISPNMLAHVYFITYVKDPTGNFIINGVNSIFTTIAEAERLGFQSIGPNLYRIKPVTKDEEKVYSGNNIRPEQFKYHIEKFNNALPTDIENFNTNYLIRMGAVSPTTIISEGKPYTFGVEIECAETITNGKMINSFNWSGMRDGSLNKGNGGQEFVTGILVGDTGFHHLNRILHAISPVSKIDSYCGIHVHIGNFKFTSEFAIAIHMACHKLQQPILAILPACRRENEYCRQLIDIGLNVDTSLTGVDYEECINKNYQLLHSYVGNNRKKNKDDSVNVRLGGDVRIGSRRPGRSIMEQSIIAGIDNNGNAIYVKNPDSPVKKRPNPNRSLRSSQHPMGAKCGYDHSTARYEWLNLVPFLYNTRGNESYSIEFRPHSASLNFDKIKNWILICMALTYYAENHYREIFDGYYMEGDMKVPINLERVITLAYPKKHNKLLEYIKLRSELFASSDTSKSESNEYKDSTANIKTIKELCV